MSKYGLKAFAETLRLEEFDKGVRVTVIAPGSVNTNFGDMPKSGDASWMLQPDDIAQAVVNLARSRDAAHLSRVEMRPARPQKRA